MAFQVLDAVSKCRTFYLYCFKATSIHGAEGEQKIFLTIHPSLSTPEGTAKCGQRPAKTITYEPILRNQKRK
jgi:hypothetical protein